MINDISQQPSTCARCSPIFASVTTIAVVFPAAEQKKGEAKFQGRWAKNQVGKSGGHTRRISFTRGGIMFWWWHVFLHTKYANAKKRKIFMKLPQNWQVSVVKSWKIRFFLCYTQGRGLSTPEKKKMNWDVGRSQWWRKLGGGDIYTTLNICQHSTEA